MRSSERAITDCVLRITPRRSGKSQAPRLLLPINFAFRLRKLFGVASRAEIIRFLLTSQLPGAQTEVVRRASGYARSNVRDAADALVAAAGGKLTNANGERFDYRAPELDNDRGIVASNGLMHDAIIERLMAARGASG